MTVSEGSLLELEVGNEEQGAPFAPVIEEKKQEASGFVPQLDGFRALAILLVLMNHMVDLRTPWPVSNICRLGWIGVDAFFVLSGFLITKILLGSKPGFRPISLFVLRRTLRTWPLYFLVLAVAFLVLHGDPSGQATNWISHVFFLQNYAPWFVTHSLGPTWSLCIEEHFYFVWPLLVFLVPRRWLYWALPVAFLTMPAIRYWGLHHAFTTKQLNTETQFHLDGLLAGSFIALGASRYGLRNRKALWFAWVALVLGAIMTLVGFRQDWDIIFGRNTVWGFTTISIGFAALLQLVLRSESSLLAKIFSLRLLRYIGRISYGIYLLQDSVISLMDRAAVHRFMGEAASNWMLAIPLRIGLTICVAAISYRFFESPILRFKERLR